MLFVIFYLLCFSSPSTMYFAISENAGRVMTTPTNTPRIVVTAKPTSLPRPKPKKIRGVMVATIVAPVATTIVKALFVRVSRDSCCIFWKLPRNNSSMIIIWWFTPVPMTATSPATDARSMLTLKKDANPDVLLNQLYSHSRLQTTFGITMVALVNNIPKTLNLNQMIYYYIEHRKDIVKKRTLFDLHKAQTRAHILEGLIIALNNIDKTIKLVKESKSVEDAKSALISNFQLSEEQSVAILEMRLQRLTSLEQDKVKQEHADLLKLFCSAVKGVENYSSIPYFLFLAVVITNSHS